MTSERVLDDAMRGAWRWLAAALVAIACLAATGVQAQAFPSKQVTIVVP